MHKYCLIGTYLSPKHNVNSTFNITLHPTHTHPTSNSKQYIFTQSLRQTQPMNIFIGKFDTNVVFPLSGVAHKNEIQTGMYMGSFSTVVTSIFKIQIELKPFSYLYCCFASTF